MEARLVVLGPEASHSSGSDDSPAQQTAASILHDRSGGPRLNRNALVFAAPDSSRLDELRAAARSYLAWKSIWDEKEELNLDELSRRQAQTQRDHFDETVAQRMNEAFVWVLVPSQEQGSAEIAWEASRVTGTDPLPTRVSKKLEQAELLFPVLGGVRLRMELDDVPLWPGDHVSTQTLWTHFARYLYLPRLRDRAVLVGAIESGVADTAWRQDTFAYAQGFDEESRRYLGLVAGSGTTVLIDSASVVVKPNVAQRQFEEDAAAQPEPSPAPEPGGGGQGATPVPDPVKPPEEKLVRRFFGVKELDPQRVSRDADQIATEIVTHLVGLVGADVHVKIEISADVPQGVPENVVRTVTENSSALKFEQYGFEES